MIGLAGCGASPPGQAGLYTKDDRCIRDQQMRQEPLVLSVAACGVQVPDLSNDPDLQRRAALSGQPFLRTLAGRDGRAHWYYCRLTGDHPGNEPSATSPFLCKDLNFTTRLDDPHDGSTPRPTG